MSTNKLSIGAVVLEIAPWVLKFEKMLSDFNFFLHRSVASVKSIKVIMLM